MDFELLHSCFEMWITSSVITGLGGQAADGKWVCEGQTLNTGTRPHRLHLTLHFAGETVVACWRSQVSHASWAHPHGSPPHYYEQQNVKNETGTQTMKETQAGWRANSPWDFRDNEGVCSSFKEGGWSLATERTSMAAVELSQTSGWLFKLPKSHRSVPKPQLLICKD